MDFGTILGILSSVGAYLYSKKKLWDYLVKIVTPLVMAAEQMAQDGVIDRAERNKLVMMTINKLVADKKIKLNIITRFLVKRVVSYIAKKLPDFKISKEAKELVAKVKKYG